MQFAYQARDVSGRLSNGTIVADDIREAAAKIKADGLYLLDVKEAKESLLDLSLLGKRISRAEVIYFTGQLSIMVDSGVPVAEALASLAEQHENRAFARKLEEVAQAVESGEDLSAALRKYPKLFNSTYTNLVKASEASGTLAPMLDRIADTLRSSLETKQKVLGAMLYPAAMLITCIGSAIFLLTYVFPKLTPMFRSRALDLPSPTWVMMMVSDALIQYWYAFVAAAVLLIGLFIYSRMQQWGRKAIDWCFLNVPIIGPMLRKVIIGRTLRTLSTTVNGGVPMLDALKLCSGVAGNYWYEQIWDDVAEQVTGGKQIHQALRGRPLIPATVTQMIASGESTGKLGAVLEKVANYYDREVSQAIKTATSLIEPAMVFVMGGVIGSIALAMLLPIFKLSGNVG
ncbi:type II secretion system F family protein [Stratiformator vulcanicus]|uniref:Type II secretion system protein F n=1 Tax=Stratiformator vulcanicus TaxID=2527980 RepID=A0A517QYH5_9PLAN|nr:type II secretion system F family protein [Stratiformator vulcanicus]QDT36707.1 Putative type II secretion system protein F [Stratiformator vulcanicus]